MNQTVTMNSTILNSSLSIQTSTVPTTMTTNSSSLISTTTHSSHSTSNLLTILSHPIFIAFAVIVLILTILSMIGTVFRHIREIRRRKRSSMEVQIWEAILAESSTTNSTYDIEQLVVRHKYIVVPLQCTCEPQVDP